MRRIVFCVTNDLSYDQRMIRICKTLTAAGYEVSLIGRQRKGSIPLVEQPFSQRRLPCYFQGGKLFYLEYNIRLLLYLLFCKADIFGAIDLDTIFPCWLAGRLRGKTITYDAHEYFTEVPEVVDRKLVKAIWTAVAAFCIPRMDVCYTVGPSLAAIFAERYRTPFAVVRNLPFARKASLKERKHPKQPAVLIYQGALNEGRGIESLIDAMAYVGHARLLLAGEGDLSQDLRQRARALPSDVKERITFLGYVQPSELKKVTETADIGFNLLENKGLSYYYSLANKAFDYIQAGVPSFQMDFPEYRDLQTLYHPFILLEDLESERLAKEINALLQDTERYSAIAENCRRAATELTWERESQRLIDLYRQEGV